MKETPNLSYIETLSGGDKVFEDTLCKIIKQELPAEFDEYQELLEKKEFKEAAKVVHKLKHKISILGLVKGYQLAISYEENLLVGSLRFQNQFEEIIDQLKEYIDQI